MLSQLTSSPKALAEMGCDCSDVVSLVLRPYSFERFPGLDDVTGSDF